MRRLLIFFIDCYKACLSPFLGNNCRFPQLFKLCQGSHRQPRGYQGLLSCPAPTGEVPSLA